MIILVVAIALMLGLAGYPIVQRRMLLSLNWPRDQSYSGMLYRTERYFRMQGWNVWRQPSKPFEFTMCNNAPEFAVKCYASGFSNSFSLVKDYAGVRSTGDDSEQRPAPLILLAIFADNVPREIIVRSLSEGVYAFHYKSLSELVKLNPATEGAVKRLVQSIVEHRLKTEFGTANCLFNALGN